MHAMSKNWYCLQVTANRVKSFEENLERMRESEDGFDELFGEVFAPAEEVVEMKRGQRKVTQRKFFPNYVFIEMEMNQRTYNLVKHLPMIKGFIGGATTKTSGAEWQEPEPVSLKEIDRIRERVEAGLDKPKPKVLFEVGKTVRIKEGPFTNFTGNVVDVNYESSRISVTVNVFSRPTEIQTDFENVEKA